MSYFRSKKKKNSTIKVFLGALNASIIHYKDFTNKEIKTLDKGKIKWSVAKKQIVYLTQSELKKLYKLIYNPEPENEIKPLKSEIIKLKHFLFRCFSGMRVGDMNKRNINPDQLKSNSRTYTYFQDKGTRKATIYCIENHLYEIAESLDWVFPTFETETKLTSYSNREAITVRKYLKLLYKEDMRKVENITEKGFHYTPLADEVSSHTARKTFAHLIYKHSNYNLLLVMKQLGHTKLEITQRYLGVDLSEEEIDYKNVNLGF